MKVFMIIWSCYSCIAHEIRMWINVKKVQSTIIAMLGGGYRKDYENHTNRGELEERERKRKIDRDIKWEKDREIDSEGVRERESLMYGKKKSDRVK